MLIHVEITVRYHRTLNIYLIRVRNRLAYLFGVVVGQNFEVAVLIFRLLKTYLTMKHAKIPLCNSVSKPKCHYLVWLCIYCTNEAVKSHFRRQFPSHTFARTTFGSPIPLHLCGYLRFWVPLTSGRPHFLVVASLASLIRSLSHISSRLSPERDTFSSLIEHYSASKPWYSLILGFLAMKCTLSCC